ncbi:MAG: hypothetical protein ABH879_02450 [archaeon]
MNIREIKDIFSRANSLHRSMQSSLAELQHYLWKDYDYLVGAVRMPTW